MQKFLDQTMTTIEPQRFYFSLWLFTPNIVVVSFNLRKHKKPVNLSLPSSVGIEPVQWFLLLNFIID